MLSTPAFQARFGPSDQMAGHFRRYEPEQMRQVLEAARNAIGRRRMRDAAAPDGRVAPETMQELTSGSGRLFQPKGAVGVLTQVGTAPFRVAQRHLPLSGVCLVARARRPDTGAQTAG